MKRAGRVAGVALLGVATALGCARQEQLDAERYKTQRLEAQVSQLRSQQAVLLDAAPFEPVEGLAVYAPPEPSAGSAASAMMIASLTMVRQGMWSGLDHSLLAEAGLSGLQIVSTPADATVEVDGKRLARTTNVCGTTRPGEHRIRLVKEGFQPAEGTVVTRVGEVATFTKSLEPIQK